MPKSKKHKSKKSILKNLKQLQIIQEEQKFDQEKLESFINKYTQLIDFLVVNDKYNDILNYLLKIEKDNKKLVDISHRKDLLFHAAYFKARLNVKTLVEVGGIDINSLDENNFNILHYAINVPTIIFKGELFKNIFNQDLIGTLDQKFIRHIHYLVKTILDKDPKLHHSIDHGEIKQFCQLSKVYNQSRSKNDFDYNNFFKKLHASNITKLFHDAALKHFTTKHDNLRDYLATDENIIKFIKSTYNFEDPFIKSDGKDIGLDDGVANYNPLVKQNNIEHNKRFREISSKKFQTILKTLVLWYGKESVYNIR